MLNARESGERAEIEEDTIRMKRLMSLLLCLMMVWSMTAALAETLNPTENRGIDIEDAEPNEWEDMRVSPTTGRVLSQVRESAPADGFGGLAITGRYMPLLVQIDNAEGGIGYDKDGKWTGKRAPWGAQYTDVIYETPLYKQGDTRLTFLFSDLIPDSVGPLRSARLFHAWLREEWDCGFIFYGQQEYTETNVPAVFKSTGADKKGYVYDENGEAVEGAGVLFLGTVGISKPWKQYFGVYEKIKLQKPHDKTVNAAAVASLIHEDFEAANHTWLFTDGEPDWDDDAEEIYVNWAAGKLSYYNSYLEYDEDEGVYYRYMTDMVNENKDWEYKTLAIKNKLEEESIPFANIIVQFTQMDWVRTDAPKPTVLGTGNADYFQKGKHMAGVWKRKELSDRTVFYDENGEELRLQRGRTLIIVMDYETDHRSVSYE